MSYMRCGYPLKYFKGMSKYYVFLSSASDKCPEYVEDYDIKYDDNCSFIELIGTIVRRETGDEEYAIKIMKTLASKLKVKQHMRKKPISDKEWWSTMNKKMKEFSKSKLGKELMKIGKPANIPRRTASSNRKRN